MPVYQILDDIEVKQFETPPNFNNAKRKKFLRLQSKVKEVNKNINNPIREVCFSLMFGYFKAISKFFSPKYFHKQDIDFIIYQLEIPMVDISFESVDRQTLYRYRKIILNHLNYFSFEKQRLEVIEHVDFIVSKQSRSRQSFDSIISFLRQNKIEIPKYQVLNSILVNAFSNYDKNIVSSLEKNIKPNQINVFEDLFNKKGKGYSWHKLTRLKTIDQSVKPERIKKQVNDTIYLREIYSKVKPLIKALELSPSLIEYYSSWVIKAKFSQIYQKDNFKRYLNMLCFVSYQYFSYHDCIVDKFQRSVQQNQTVADNFYKNWLIENQKLQLEKTETVINHSLKQDDLIEKVYSIVVDTELKPEDKLTNILALLSKRTKNNDDKIKEIINNNQNFKSRSLKKEIYYEYLEDSSRKLQKRVSNILQILNFNNEYSEIKLIKAINYYSKKKAIVTPYAPKDFLKEDLIIHFKSKTSKFRTSLYKSLLFSSVFHGIKSGSLNLNDTHKYKSFEEYLFPKDIWIRDKAKLLKQSGLEEFSDCKKVLEKYSKSLNDQYIITNERINNGKNEYIKFDKNNNFFVKTPAIERPETINLSSYFPQSKYISLTNILSAIQNHCHYLSDFQHYSLKYISKKPEDHIFYAGIMGYGCQIGVNKIAQISNGINESELENTVTWYFSLDNIKKANNKVLQFIQTLELPEFFKKSSNSLHTSSDGQKYQVPKESLNANYSFKYFGKGRGSSVYSFIDERHLLFHSEVISSSEREAAWVIDGLMNNEVIKSEIHSTDTHGYSEIIFGVMHLLEYVFAPRIKNLKKQLLYSFPENTIGFYKNKSFKTIPDRYIQIDLIEKYWDDILRFIVTIKLKHTNASQLFKRLTSYSRENPFYRALKSFGQIFKSLFILKYLDNLDLRQDVEKQLNKIESANRFSKAVQFGNGSDFLYATKEEQNISANCKRLIQNCIICWNYLYLSNILAKSSKKEEKELLKIIKQSSIVHWKHVNFHGTYDFTNLENEFFDLSKIRAWKLPSEWAKSINL